MASLAPLGNTAIKLCIIRCDLSGEVCCKIQQRPDNAEQLFVTHIAKGISTVVTT